MRPIRTAGEESGKHSFLLPAPDHVDARVLGVESPVSVTVPAGARYVIFSASATFYVRWTGTAATPVGAVSDGSASEMNPGARSLDGVSSFSVVAPAGAIVTMAFYA